MFFLYESFGHSEEIRVLLLMPIAAPIVHNVLILMLSKGYLHRTKHRMQVSVLLKRLLCYL
jgi:hypothetical protein